MSIQTAQNISPCRFQLQIQCFPDFYFVAEKPDEGVKNKIETITTGSKKVGVFKIYIYIIVSRQNA